MQSPQLYARILGTVEWFCPKCYGFNRDRIWPKHFKVLRCNRKDCNTHYMVGLVFHQTCTGFKIPAPDVFMPTEHEVNAWRSGQNLNKLRFAADGDLSPPDSSEET